MTRDVREQIEERARSAFAFLPRDHGFGEPQPRRDAFATTLAYLRDPLAIEVKIEWRQQEVTVLLVRLEDGELPAGYYVSGGRKSRVYLATWLARRGWLDRPPGRSSRRAGKGSSPAKTPADLERRLQELAELLARHLPKLLAEPLAPFA